MHIPTAGHWILVRIDVQQHNVFIYDSLPCKEYAYIENSLRKFISEESKTKIMTREKKQMEIYLYYGNNIFDSHGSLCNFHGLPCQVNNKDCGVFVLKVKSTLLREEVKTDLLQWKQVLEVGEVEDSG
ncbi:uncharacterized protein LOC144349076 [Saccoglossus kowalevskii]